MLASVVVFVVGFGLVALGLLDAFETVVLPRRVSRRFRIALIFYRVTWQPYKAMARRIQDAARRETFLSFFGPLSLILLFIVWAFVLIIGFSLLQWAAGSGVSSQTGPVDYPTVLYLSGTTFFTLGLGDVVPSTGFARLLTVVEGGTGFGFLALVIGYLPTVYQMFARRETNVSLLDQRAGSPPSVGELLRRNILGGDMTVLNQLMREWESWVADLLESHLSYPTLAYFRSQHEDQSWLAALAVILDLCAFIQACGSSRANRQAAFTFAMARHAVADLAEVFGTAPRAPDKERLDPAAARRLWELIGKGVHSELIDTEQRLVPIRAAYEPYLVALSEHLLMELPPWVPRPGATDNWETTAWDFVSPAPALGPDSPFHRETPVTSPTPRTDW